MVLTAVLLGLFMRRIPSEGPTALLAECEHLLAFATGVVVERTWGVRN